MPLTASALVLALALQVSPADTAGLSALPARERVDSTARIALRLRDRDPAAGLALATAALDAARDAAYPQGEAALLVAMGVSLNILGRNEESLERYGRALQVIRSVGDEHAEANALRSRGVSLYDMGRLDDALEDYLAALSLSEALGDSANVARTASNIGNVHWAADRPADAVPYHERALAVFRSLGDQVGVAGVSINLGAITAALAEDAPDEDARTAALDRAANHYRTALRLFTDMRNPRGIAHASHNLGRVESRRGHAAEALPLYRRALAIREQVGDLAGQVESHTNIGRAELALGRHRAAVASLARATRMAEEGSMQLRDPEVYRDLAYAYEADGNPEAALEAQRSYTALRLEAAEARTTERIAELTLDFRKERQEQEISMLRTNEELQALQIYRQRTIIAGLGGGAALAVGLLLLLGIRYRERARETEVLHKVSRTDALTGLANRRDVLERLTAELRRCRREGHPFALVMADLDDFKRINDTLGHDAGDEALLHVAERMRAVLRDTDLAGRWGGEEFLVILPGKERDEARMVAERIRSAVETTPWTVGGNRVSLTLTLGVATFRGEETLEECLRTVDQLLLAGKRGGKNRVEAAD